jgi:purine-binding chemotaxis protein CheW
MDILSIRKKKGLRPAADPPATASTSPQSPGPSPSQSPTYVPILDGRPTEAAARAQPERQSIPVVVSATPAPGDGRGVPAVKDGNTLRVRSAPDVAPDPLTGFLARYDDDQDADDDFGGIHVETIDGGDRYLSFVLGGESYAASIMDVREILTIRSLTDVPRAPREVLGVVSKRGLVLPVIDLATALGLRTPDRRLRASQRVLVVGDGDRICGLRVDAVSEVIKLSAQNIEAVPPSIGVKNAGLLLGLGRIDSHLYILLDLGAVLDSFAMSLGLSPLRQQGGR